MQAMPAAPAPTITTETSSGRLPTTLQRVQERRQHDDGGAVLVVVEDGDVELLAQPPLDLEAARRGDVLEVDAAEARRDRLDGAHDLVDVLRGEAEREGVDAAELLEQHRLALHHGHRRLGPDVAEAEHGGAVGDDRDGVALDGQRPGALGGSSWIAMQTRATPGRVGHREVVAGAHRRLRRDLDLAAEVQQEGAVGDADCTSTPGSSRTRVDDALAVLGVGGVDRDVAARSPPGRPARGRSRRGSPPASPIAAATLREGCRVRRARRRGWSGCRRRRGSDMPEV